MLWFLHNDISQIIYWNVKISIFAFIHYLNLMFFAIKFFLSFGIINDVNRNYIYIYEFHGQIEGTKFINYGKFVEKINKLI
jgi:hypothetical protein